MCQADSKVVRLEVKLFNGRIYSIRGNFIPFGVEITGDSQITAYPQIQFMSIEMRYHHEK